MVGTTSLGFSGEIGLPQFVEFMGVAAAVELKVHARLSVVCTWGCCVVGLVRCISGLGKYHTACSRKTCTI